MSLEFAARVFFPPASRIERILGIIEQDGKLFWRQRPGMDRVFEGARIKTNRLGFRDKELKAVKDAGTFRIVCLGGSPTFGWGVPEPETYPRRLEQLLQKEYGAGRKIEVINAGEIGYSSLQGTRLLSGIISGLAPDLITVSYVINDVDKYRFFRSNGQADKELARKKDWLVYTENVVARSRLVAVLQKISTRLAPLAMRHFGKIGGGGVYPETRRVSREDYRHNLREIIRTARAKGIAVLFVKLPVNLPQAEEVPAVSREQARLYLDAALKLGQEGQYREAISILERAVTADPYLSPAYFYLGQYWEKSGNSKQAESYFQNVVKMEIYDCEKLGKVYNGVMETVAREEGVVLADIVSAFNTFRQDNDQYLFLDPQGDTIHPNSLGHALIAREILSVLQNNRVLTGGLINKP